MQSVLEEARDAETCARARGLMAKLARIYRLLREAAPDVFYTLGRHEKEEPYLGRAVDDLREGLAQFRVFLETERLVKAPLALSQSEKSNLLNTALDMVAGRRAAVTASLGRTLFGDVLNAIEGAAAKLREGGYVDTKALVAEERHKLQAQINLSIASAVDLIVQEAILSTLRALEEAEEGSNGAPCFEAAPSPTFTTKAKDDKAQTEAAEGFL